MPSVRRIIENVWPGKKIFLRLQELLNFIQNNANNEQIILSIERTNHSREYCQLTLTELEMIYMLVPRINRSLYECICENDVIKTYMDFEYLLEKNSSVDHHRAVITCLKILFFYLNNSSKLNINTEPDLSAILNEFLILDAYVFRFPNFS
jgi:hypothetical protein